LAVKPPKPCVWRDPTTRVGCPEYAVPSRDYWATHVRPREPSPSGTVAHGSPWRKLRRAILDSTPRPLICGICGRVIDDSDESKIELDHVVPFADRGDPFLGRDGLRLTHKACNARRRNESRQGPSPAQRRKAADQERRRADLVRHATT
jgi:hypothetical protein